jgi:hypothetical protein
MTACRDLPVIPRVKRKDCFFDDSLQSFFEVSGLSDGSPLPGEADVERDGRLSKQFRNNLFTAYFLVFCNILKNFMQCKYVKRFVAGNGQVMGFAGNRSRQALVATRLMVNTIQYPYRLRRWVSSSPSIVLGSFMRPSVLLLPGVVGLNEVDPRF